MTTVTVSTDQSLHPVATGTIDITNPVSEIIEATTTNLKMEVFWDWFKTIYAFVLLGFGLFFPFVLIAWQLIFEAS